LASAVKEQSKESYNDFIVEAKSTSNIENSQSVANLVLAESSQQLSLKYVEKPPFPTKSVMIKAKL